MKPGIRPIDPDSAAEIRLVASRMRETLIEVLGEDRGGSMYSLEWLEQRVRWHLDASAVTGAVFLAQDDTGAILGHTIVRLETGESAHATVGLFATTYVHPDARRDGVASALLQHGERWLREHGMTEALTYTDKDNSKLQQLYTQHGYTLYPAPDDFVRLAKALD